MYPLTNGNPWTYALDVVALYAGLIGGTILLVSYDTATKGLDGWRVLGFLLLEVSFAAGVMRLRASSTPKLVDRPRQPVV